MEYVTVNDVTVPALGLGTYKLRGQECVETVVEALEMGYRHVDTAEYYRNQAEIGEALAAADVDREDVFLTTKVWRTNLAYDDVRTAAHESLRKLGVDAVDLLLIHWPNQSVPVEETLDAMNDLQEEGKVRHVGVSNFSPEQLAEAMAVSETPILTDQVEYNPYTSQADLLEFCVEHDVMLTAYSPLGKGGVADDDVLADIGAAHGKSPAQVALRWLVQQANVSVIPKASSRAHLEANAAIFDFELSDAEMDRIFDLQGGLTDRVRRALGL